MIHRTRTRTWIPGASSCWPGSCRLRAGLRIADLEGGTALRRGSPRGRLPAGSPGGRSLPGAAIPSGRGILLAALALAVIPTTSAWPSGRRPLGCRAGCMTTGPNSSGGCGTFRSPTVLADARTGCSWRGSPARRSSRARPVTPDLPRKVESLKAFLEQPAPWSHRRSSSVGSAPGGWSPTPGGRPPGPGGGRAASGGTGRLGAHLGHLGALRLNLVPMAFRLDTGWTVQPSRALDWCNLRKHDVPALARPVKNGGIVLPGAGSMNVRVRSAVLVASRAFPVDVEWTSIRGSATSTSWASGDGRPGVEGPGAVGPSEPGLPGPHPLGHREPRPGRRRKHGSIYDLPVAWASWPAWRRFPPGPSRAC
jgi:hypothetical protein